MLSALLLFTGAYANMDVSSPTHHGRGTVVFDSVTTIGAATAASPVLKVTTTTCVSISASDTDDAAGYADAADKAADECTSLLCAADQVLETDGTAQHFNATAAAAGISLPTTEIAALVLIECPADSAGGLSNITGVLTFSVQYSYTITTDTAANDNWDGAKKDDDLHFKGLKNSTGYMCFLTDKGEFDTDPHCGAPGSTTELNSDARVRDGDASQCTAAAGSAGGLKLTVKNAAQDHIRARHCLYAGDVTSPVVALSFSGTTEWTLIGFYILVVLATLSFILAMLAWNDARASTSSTTSDLLGGTYRIAGNRLFLVAIAGFVIGACFLAHAQWGDSTELYITISFGVAFVVLPLAFEFFGENIMGMVNKVESAAEEKIEFLPRWGAAGVEARPVRVVSVHR